jgi:hypothetical protein
MKAILKMNRKQKIEFLKALQRGEQSVKALKQARGYFAEQLNHDLYIVKDYAGDGKDKTMTRIEYENFLQELDKHNKFLGSGKTMKNFVFLLQNEESIP